MKILKELEENFLKKNTYSDYSNIVQILEGQQREDYASQIRYALSICFNSYNQGIDSFAFIGGMGVLGNLVLHKGTSIIPRWRGTRDIDIILQDVALNYIISNSFDDLDTNQKSLSIPNKWTIRGCSKDKDSIRLGATVVDVYSPKKPKGEIPLKNINIISIDWENRRNVDFFGINFPVLNPISLLREKLEVKSKDGLPRTKDQRDICSLVYILELEKYDFLNNLNYELPTHKQKILEEVLRNNFNDFKKDVNQFYPSKNFIKKFAKRK